MRIGRLINHLWYSNEIIIVKQKDINHNIDCTKEAFLEKSIFNGEAWRLRSVLYKNFIEYDIKCYGTIENALIIEI